MRNLAPLLLFSLISCTYSPDEEYIKEIKKPNNPTQTSISLNDFEDSEDIYLTEPTDFKFTLSSNAGKLELVEILFDSNIIYTGNSSTGTFSIYESYFINGLHKLKIQFRNTSGSGSLAEKAGGEKFQVWREWNVHISTAPPAKRIPVFSEENGYLKVSWLPFTGNNFVSYTVISKLPSGAIQLVTITDKDQNFIINDDYVGGYDIEYTVSLKTIKHSIEGNPVKRDDQLNLKVDYNVLDSTATVTWDKADFTSVLDKYVIYENAKAIKEITNASDTTASFKAGVVFGKPLVYTVELKAKLGISPSENYEVSSLFKKLAIIPSKKYYNKTLNGMVGWQNESAKGSIPLYDKDMVRQFSLTADWLGDCAVPYTSPYVYYKESGGMRLVQTNLETLENKYFDIKQLLGISSTIQFLWVSSASSNQVLCFNYSIFTGGKFVEYKVIYDIVNKSVLYHAADSGYPFMISNEGQYLAMAGKMYRVNGSSLTLLYSTLPVGSFRPDNEEEIIQTTTPSFGSKVNIFGSSTGLMKKSTSSPESFEGIFYDPAIKSFLFTQSQQSKIYKMDADTGTITSIEAYTKDYFDIAFIGGFIIDKNGYYVKAWK
jgi:hypothetical protein